MTTQEQAVQTFDFPQLPGVTSEDEAEGANQVIQRTPTMLSRKECMYVSRDFEEPYLAASNDDIHLGQVPYFSNLHENANHVGQNAETKIEKHVFEKETKESCTEGPENGNVNFHSSEYLNTCLDETNRSNSGNSSDYLDDASVAHNSRRPKAKRRMSSKIRRLQETIREAQIKDAGGKDDVCSREKMERSPSAKRIVASANVLVVRAIKEARRQRSKSRTKLGKMKCDQLQRPYRRWLGVSTCSSQDTRYIVGKYQAVPKLQTVKEDNILEDTVSPKTSAYNDTDISIRCPEIELIPGDAESGERHCKFDEVAMQNECVDKSTRHKNDVAIDTDECFGCQIEENTLVTRPNRSRRGNSADHVRFDSRTNDTVELIAEYAEDQLFEPVQEIPTETKIQVEMHANKAWECKVMNSQSNFSPDSSSIDVIRMENLPPVDKESVPKHRQADPKEGCDLSMDRSPLTLPHFKESEDMCIIHPAEDGGLAGNASTQLVREFESPLIYQSTRGLSQTELSEWTSDSGSFCCVTAADESEWYKYKDSLHHVTQKKSTIKSLMDRFRGLQKKTAHYVSVRAIADSGGTLPGQLKFQKGQTIQQLVTGRYASATATAEDSFHLQLQYGYYRVGRLRRKVYGIYPGSLVRLCLENSDSEADCSSLAVAGSPEVKMKNSRKKKRKKGKQIK